MNCHAWVTQFHMGDTQRELELRLTGSRALQPLVDLVKVTELERGKRQSLAGLTALLSTWQQ